MFAPIFVTANLMRFRRNVWRPLGLHHAMVAPREGAQAVGIAAVAGIDMLFAYATYRLYPFTQCIFNCVFPGHVISFTSMTVNPLRRARFTMSAVPPFPGNATTKPMSGSASSMR